MTATSIRVFAVAVVLILGLYSSIAVPELPGWEEEPEKYTLNIYIVCDHSCNQFLGDSKAYFKQFIDTLNKPFAEVNLEVVLVGLDILNKTEWISSPIHATDMGNLLRVLQNNMQYFKNKTYFEALLYFTNVSLTAGGLTPVLGAASGKKVGDGYTSIAIKMSPDLTDFVGTIAHEIGHSLGVNHDNEQSVYCACPVESCIMTSKKIDVLAFSNCSVQALNDYLKQHRSQPLKKATAPTAFQVFGARCGNGIVEEGEECDCSPGCLPQGCCNCCKQCKLVEGAQCASGRCCNTETCKFQPLGKKCRGRRDSSCDLDDFCSGNSSECENKYLPNWMDCNDFANETGYCKNGFCNTINTQCRFIWGEGYKGGRDDCYNGRITVDARTSNDYKCQQLMCEHKNDGSFNLERRYAVIHRVNWVGDSDCMTGSYLDVETTYLGLSGKLKVEDGTKCAPFRACYSGRCISKIDAIRQIEKLKPYHTKTQYCGNGAKEDGEDCDCGSYQCDCCDSMTCKFLPKDAPCLSSCGLCPGNSVECLNDVKMPAVAKSNFKPCSGEQPGLCLNGECQSSEKVCAMHWMGNGSFDDDQSRPTGHIQPNFFRRNVNRSNLSFNSGGFFALDAKNGKSLYYSEFRIGEDDGSCGIVNCYTPPNDTAYYYRFDNTSRAADLFWKLGRNNFFNNSFPVKTFSNYYDNKKVSAMYYQPDAVQEIDTPNFGKKNVTIYHPVLTLDGTPCYLYGNETLGYCKTFSTQSTKIPTITYRYSKCVQVPNQDWRKTYYPIV